MSYSKLCKKPLIFRSFTGVTVSEFQSICNEIEHNYEEHERRRLLSRMMTKKKKKRIRDIGAGRPFKLKVKERFVMLLVYYRLYITYIPISIYFLILFYYYPTCCRVKAIIMLIPYYHHCVFQK